MNRQMLEQHLAQAEAHISEGVGHIARQREIIERLHAAGLDTATAKELLGAMEEAQALHVAERDRIAEEVKRADGGQAAT